MVGSGKIGFPGLGISDFALSKTAFTVMGIHIYWYGIMIALGFLGGVILASRLAKKYGENPDNILDLALISTPLAIIFARLYYVIFQLKSFKSFWDIVNIRQGGLAIYGGVIGAVLSAYFYCRWKKFSFTKYMDIMLPGLLLGQAIGRWGNFFNQEAFGGDTTLPWRMRIEIGGLGGGIFEVHPTFLYEFLWNTIGVIALVWLLKRKKFSGEVMLGYVAWYGFGRMFIEGLRTDSLMIFENIRVSQVLAAVSCLAAIALIIVLRIRAAKQPSEEIVIENDEVSVSGEEVPDIETEKVFSKEDNEKDNSEDSSLVDTEN